MPLGPGSHPFANPTLTGRAAEVYAAILASLNPTPPTAPPRSVAPTTAAGVAADGGGLWGGSTAAAGDPDPLGLRGAGAGGWREEGVWMYPTLRIQHTRADGGVA
jgi:hypothetical protein